MPTLKGLGWIILLLSIMVSLWACSSEKINKEKKASQALVSVNGSEITMLQLNDELARAGVRADQFEVASKQILESLIARQLIVEEAGRTKLDRTPEVMQARERANAQVIAQAYLQRITNKLSKPTKEEIEEFYRNKSDFFQKRKQLDLTIVKIAANDFSKGLKLFADNAKSIDEITAWLNKQNVQYVRNITSRSTADLPLNTVTRLLEKDRNPIFVAQEQNQSLFIAVNSVNDAAITLVLATPQIEKFLMNQKYRNSMDEEVTRLRSTAKIDYFGDNAPNSSLKESDVNTTPLDSSLDIKNLENIDNNLIKSDVLPAERSIERGMMGLK